MTFCSDINLIHTQTELPCFITIARSCFLPICTQRKTSVTFLFLWLLKSVYDEPAYTRLQCLHLYVVCSGTTFKKILHQWTNDKKFQKAIWAEDWISPQNLWQQIYWLPADQTNFPLLAGSILVWSEEIWTVHFKPIGCFLRVYIGVPEKGEYLSCKC